MFNIFDLHNDFILSLRGRKKEKYVKKAENNRIISAVWTSELNIDESMSEIDKAKKYVASHSNLFLGVEDLHFLSKTNLEKFILTKPIYAGLTWNNCNVLAGGAHEFGGLTSFGRKVAKKLEESEIKIDYAHLNEESFMDLSRVASKPIFCSHTAFFGVNENPRNLKDYQLKMIVDSGGLVGLCLVSDFLTGKSRCSISDIVTHIDYFACKFGINNIAIGTDFYGTKHLPDKCNSYRELILGLSEKLKKLGYSEKSICKILFENANDFFF